MHTKTWLVSTTSIGVLLAGMGVAHAADEFVLNQPDSSVTNNFPIQPTVSQENVAGDSAIDISAITEPGAQTTGPTIGTDTEDGNLENSPSSVTDNEVSSLAIGNQGLVGVDLSGEGGQFDIGGQDQALSSVATQRNVNPDNLENNSSDNISATTTGAFIGAGSQSADNDIVGAEVEVSEARVSAAATGNTATNGIVGDATTVGQLDEFGGEFSSEGATPSGVVLNLSGSGETIQVEDADFLAVTGQLNNNVVVSANVEGAGIGVRANTIGGDGTGTGSDGNNPAPINVTDSESVASATANSATTAINTDVNTEVTTTPVAVATVQSNIDTPVRASNRGSVIGIDSVGSDSIIGSTTSVSGSTISAEAAGNVGSSTVGGFDGNSVGGINGGN